MPPSFYLFVNGNRVHMDDVVDGRHVPRTFATEADGEAFADALYEKTRDENRALGYPFPPRESYVVSETAPLVAAPYEPPTPAER